MAHNLNFNEQTRMHSFFSVKEKPWHGLGKIVDDYPTSKEAIEFAGLNYTIEKRKLFTPDKPNENFNNNENEIVSRIQIPDFFATVRTDTNQVLGIVGKDYELVQNEDAFSFFDTIIGGDGILYETAGALGQGERIFITAKLPDYIKVGNNDLIEKFIFLTTSHDGYGSISAAFTPIRIVCNNTLTAALKNCSNCIKIRHTQNVKERLEQAHKVMGISNQLLEDLGIIFNRWAKIKITDGKVKRLIQLAMAPNKEVLKNIESGNEDELSTCFVNICDKVYEYGISSPSQLTETTKGTLFGAYNAITGYFQNVRSYKDEEAKLKSLLFNGTAQMRTQHAFKLCERFSRNGDNAFQLN
jgi:phage/plasmid-like protein (TIGR03299 family)